jgi:hypothetical protein
MFGLLAAPSFTHRICPACLGEHGGAGGVGHLAIQLAASRDATVYATGTGDSLEFNSSRRLSDGKVA